MISANFRRNITSLVVLTIGCSWVGIPAASAQSPSSFLRKVFRRDVSSELKNVAYELAKEDGPWMILATTFVGENAKNRAQRAVEEIRRELRLPAYIYEKEFDFTKTLNDAGSRTRRMRHANAYEYEAYAVLVGEYDRVDHPSVDRDLERLKTFQLSIYKDINEVRQETNMLNPATTIQAVKHSLFSSRKGAKRGPMRNAFVTSNPLLPEEYFSAPKVDSFVRQLNGDGAFKEFNLLENNGNYTVTVCTFEGLGTIVDGKQEKDFVPSAKRLDKYAADAVKVLRKLRADGEEAYQFHDRYRSLVTVGSFETLGRELPNGSFQYSPEILRVMQKYSAFNAQHARTVPGRNGIAANHAALVPFDIQPTPIAVPKASKRSLYAPRFGMR